MPLAASAVTSSKTRKKKKSPAVAEALMDAAAASRRAELIRIVEEEAKKKLKWSNASSEAEKYLRPLREPMRRLGHIGREPIFYNWCAAFVTWCCRQAGYAIPDQPTGYSATVALVDAWRFWGKQQGYIVDHSAANLRSGDILLYEWFDGDRDLDHIGVFLRLRSDGNIEAAEGNAGSEHKSAITNRNPSTVMFAVRLPD